MAPKLYGKVMNNQPPEEGIKNKTKANNIIIIEISSHNTGLPRYTVVDSAHLLQYAGL